MKGLFVVVSAIAMLAVAACAGPALAQELGDGFGCSIIDTWTRLPGPPVSTNIPAAACWGGKLYLLGGVELNYPPYDEPFSDKIRSYDPSVGPHGTWTTETAVTSYGLIHQAQVCVVSGKIIMGSCLGPTSWNGWGRHSKVIQYDPAAGTCVETADYGYIGWSQALIDGGNGYAYSFGNWTGGGVDGIYRYDPSAVPPTLTLLSAKLGAARGSISGIQYGGKIYLFGGNQSGNLVEVFDVATEAIEYSQAITPDELVDNPDYGIWSLCVWDSGCPNVLYVASTKSNLVYEFNVTTKVFTKASFTIDPFTTQNSHEVVRDPVTGNVYDLTYEWKPDQTCETQVWVASANNPPVAVDDKAATMVGVPVDVNVLANDDDQDGDTLSVTDVTQGAHGAVTINPGGKTVHYNPAPGFSGTDTFDYTVSDGNGGSDTGTVEVTVGCIMLTSPNGGETFVVGTVQPVTWKYGTAGCNVGPSVRVALLKGGVVRSVISDHALVGAGGRGGLQWTVPTNLPAGDDYQIRVTSVRNSAITDTSDGNFTVSDEPEFSMMVTAPNTPNTVWVRGKKQTIAWTYTGIPRSTVKIDLLKNGLVECNVTQNCFVGSNGQGKCDWLVPAFIAPGSNYKIRIALTSRPDSCDASDSPFKICLTDPPNPCEMVYIPSGAFLMGNNGSEPYSYSNELPQRQVNLPGYWIGKYEVTRGQYREFMTATGHPQPWYWSAVQDWGTGDFIQSDDSPVVGVTWYDAEAFCKWAGGHLPTEAQWEKAARWTGSYASVYPWGNTWDKEKCNNWGDTLYVGCQTSPVGSYPSGVSPSGCHDMAGNVWEWCKDWYKSYPGSGSPFDYTNSYRVLRGCGWSGNADDARCAHRGCDNPYALEYYYGFRLAR